MAGKTISEKILPAKSGLDTRAGDIVVADLDLTYSHDGNRPLAMELLSSMGTSRVWNPDKYILFLDHHPSPNAVSAAAHTRLRQFAMEQGCRCMKWATASATLSYRNEDASPRAVW